VTAQNKTRPPADTEENIGLPAFMTEEMAHARLGIVYLFANLACDEDRFVVSTDGVLDFLGSTPVKPVAPPATKDPAKLAEALDRAIRANEAVREIDAARLVSRPETKPATPEEGALRDALGQELERIARLVADATRDQLAGGLGAAASAVPQAADIWASRPGLLKQVTRYIAETAASQAQPFVLSGLTTAAGLIDAFETGCKRYLVYSHGKRVSVVPGTPTTTIDGIKRAMDLTLAENVYTTLKGGTQLIVEGITAGASSAIGRIVFSAIDAVASFVKRAHDFYYMRQFLNEARAHWADRDRPDALHRRPYDFNLWYRNVAMRVPVIPALTLNSGICGDKAHMLRMFSLEGEVITQAKFDAGVAYIDELKTWGARYLAEVGYVFESSDAVVAELVKTVEVPANEKLRTRLWTALKKLVPRK
jgi:hypothetical protein